MEGGKRTVHIWAESSCQEWTLRLGKGAVRGLGVFVLKLSRDVTAGAFSFFCGGCGRRDQRRCRRGQLCGVSGGLVYGRAAGASECDKYTGAMGGYHGEWRRLPHEAEYSPTGNDPAYCDQRDWWRRGRSVADQNASSDVSQSFALADVGRDAAFRIRQALDRAHIRGNVG